MTINFFKSFFLGITCSLFMSCHSHEAPPMQMPFIESAIQFADNYHIITIAVGVFLIKYFILNPILNYIIEHDGPVFLANILYYMTTRVNAALLWKACSDNDTHLALKCLKYGANPRLATEDYEGPFSFSFLKIRQHGYGGWKRHGNALQIACAYRNKELVEALLNAGADVNDDYCSSIGRPLEVSLKTEFDLPKCTVVVNYDIVKILLQHNALLKFLQPPYSDILNKSAQKKLINIFCTLSSEQDVIIPENAIENIVNHILFITKACNYWFGGRSSRNCYFLFCYCNGKWIYHLCNMIHNHIKNEKQRNDLLLKLYNVNTKQNYQEKLQSNIIKSILINNNSTLTQSLEQEKFYNTYCKEHLNELLSLACKKNNKTLVKQFYDKYSADELNLDKIWKNAATMNTTCLKTLLKLSDNPREILQKKNYHNETIFYLAITHNDSFREKALQYVTKHIQNDQMPFFEQQIDNIIDLTGNMELDIFLQFYNDNENLQQLIQPVVKKATEQYTRLCKENMQNYTAYSYNYTGQCLEKVCLKLNSYVSLQTQTLL